MTPDKPEYEDEDDEHHIVARHIVDQLKPVNEQAAERLLELTRVLTTELAHSNHLIADKLAEHNKRLADDLKDNTRAIAEKLVISTQEIAQLLIQSQRLAQRFEDTGSLRFDMQKRWNWSLILINALIAVITFFFAISFLKVAIAALFANF